ncbi:MAG: hypothetical protein Q8O59_01355 [bacterium]|nr:hypothetical protein [bacterium]
METLDQNLKVGEKLIEFKTEAEKLYNLIIQSSGILELADDFRAVSSRTRVETAATLLKEFPDTDDEKMIEYRKKILYECKQGISSFKPKNEQDQGIKEEIIKVINQLETFGN